MAKFLDEVDRLEKKLNKRRMDKIRRLPCYKCIWSTYLENIIYCPYVRCIKNAE